MVEGAQKSRVRKGGKRKLGAIDRKLAFLPQDRDKADKD